MLPSGNFMAALIHQEQLGLEFIQQHINEVPRPHPYIANSLHGETDLLAVMLLEQIACLFLNLRSIRLIVRLLVEMQDPPALYIFFICDRIELAFAGLFVVLIEQNRIVRIIVDAFFSE